MGSARTGIASEVPAPVRALLDALADAGHAAQLVGGCVRDLVLGRSVADFDVATSAPPEAVLALFERAVPIGLRHGTVMVPTRSGPVDVTRYRAGASLEDDLAHRDFTLNAMAWDPRSGDLCDPFDGRADLAKGVLRAVGSARERLAEDPLRALRAARLVATLGLEVDPELERALRGATGSLANVATERIRRELELLLLGPHVADALALLRRTGIEAELAPGTRDDAPRVVERLPAEFELRLAGWLRGAPLLAIARRLRLSRRRAERIERLLRLHPLDSSVRSLHAPDVRRLLKRAGDDGVRELLALREAELAAGSVAEAEGARARLDAIRAAVERARRAGAIALYRQDLALDGRAVMRILGCPPGPQVGRALAFLTERVIDDPECNTPEGLRALLEEWGKRGRSRVS